MNVVRLLTTAFSLFMVILVASASQAQGIDSLAVETRTKEIANQLMAPCCWSETAAKHESQIAKDMRRQIRAWLIEGRSEDQIIQAFVGRYGERILANPPKKGFNWTLYLLPPVAVLLGAWVVARFFRRQEMIIEKEASPASKSAPPDFERLSHRVEEELKGWDP